MSSLANEIDNAMQRLDAAKASRLERLLRDRLALALADDAPATGERPPQQHQAWLRKLEELRNSVGTGKTGPSTEAILDELRAERGE